MLLFDKHEKPIIVIMLDFLRHNYYLNELSQGKLIKIAF